ncbi:MAG TPA: sugar transferase [Actinobacteria bacterium]|nr:sugar transferase [Actinomycetota bacterium]
MKSTTKTITKSTERARIMSFGASGTWVEPLLLFASDIVALMIASFSTGQVLGYIGYPLAGWQFYTQLFSIFLLTALVTFKLSGLYSPKLGSSSSREIPAFAGAIGAAEMLTLSFWFLVIGNLDHIGPFVLLWPGAVALTFVQRAGTRVLLAKLRSHGIALKNVLIVGAGEVGNNLAKKLKHNPHFGLRPIGFVDGNPPIDIEQEHLKILGAEKELLLLVGAYNIDHVVFCFSSISHKLALAAIRECQENGVNFSIVPRLFEAISQFDSIEAVQSIPLISLRKQSYGPLKIATKRIIDIVGSALALFLASPLLIIAWLLIRLDSPGPVIYRQQRCGAGGKSFMMLKFRSMVDGADKLQEELQERNEALGPIFKIKDDPRQTRMGKWLRKYSVDEVPQFVNVLKGEMSLVGPRPPIPEEVQDYQDWHLERLAVKPGITGLWQTTGRSDLTFDEMVKLDIDYIRNWTIWLDIVLLLKTLPAVLARRGAY